MSDDFKDILAVFDDDKDNKDSDDGKVDKVEEPIGQQKPPASDARPVAPRLTPPAADARAARFAATAVPPSTSLPPSFSATPMAAGKSGSPLTTVLIFLVLLLVLASLSLNAVCLNKLKRLSLEQRVMNETMRDVKTSADRSWRVQCGIYFPVPNQRPQEYQIMYEEKDGKLLKSQFITRPLE